MAKLGCLLFLVFAAWMTAEVWVVLQVGQWLKATFPAWIGTGWFEAFALAIATTVLGVMIARWHASRLQAALVGTLMGQGGGRLGRHLIGLAGGICLALPGFMSDVVGLLLILPPMPWLLAGLGQKIVMGIVRTKLGQMGKAGGMPGGFQFPPGFPGAGGMPGGFPGMHPRKGPKTYDTVAEPDDRVERR